MAKRPWCHEHDMHPNDCFEIHYPNSVRDHPVPYDEVRLEIIHERIRKQNESIRREAEKMDKSIVDARKRFDENRRKGA